MVNDQKEAVTNVHTESERKKKCVVCTTAVSMMTITSTLTRKACYVMTFFLFALCFFLFFSLSTFFNFFISDHHHHHHHHHHHKIWPSLAISTGCCCCCHDVYHQHTATHRTSTQHCLECTQNQSESASQQKLSTVVSTAVTPQQLKIKRLSQSVEPVARSDQVEVVIVW